MGPLAAGQVVLLLPFPFSNLTRSKLRSALLIASAGREDWIACQITSNSYAGPQAVTLTDSDFAQGGLQRISYVRPAKLFTADQSLIVGNPGTINWTVLNEIRDALIAISHGNLGKPRDL